MTSPSTRLGYLAAFITAIGVASCGKNSLGLAGPADSVTADVGATARDEVEAAVSALTPITSLEPIGTTPAAPTSFPAPCVTPSSATDSDGDGVPDDATYIFTAPPCRFTGWRGGTLDVVGQLRIQDPAPTSAGFGYEATVTGLRSRFTNASNTVIYDVTRNGTRTVSGSTAALLLTADLQVVRTFAGHPDAAIDKKWSVDYTPLTPLQINGPLPSGSLDIAGTADWTRGTEHFALTITTPTPLQYDASCTDTVQRIRAGEMHLAGTFDTMNGFVRVTWNGCGHEPTFGFETTG